MNSWQCGVGEAVGRQEAERRRLLGTLAAGIVSQEVFITTPMSSIAVAACNLLEAIDAEHLAAHGQQRSSTNDMTIAQGRKLRDQNLDLFEGRALLGVLRDMAIRIAQDKGRVSANDVRPMLPPNLPKKSRSVMGAIFRGKSWVPVGITYSDEPRAHARWIREWQYLG